MDMISSQRPDEKYGNSDNQCFSSASSVINAALTEEIFKQKCKKHPRIPCDMLYLKSDVQNHRICILCVQENNIPNTQILSLHQLLGETDDDMFMLTYPVLTDQSIGFKIKPLIGCVEKIINEVDVFFNELSKEIYDSIEKMKANSKLKLSTFAQMYTQTISSYQEVGQVQQLKELVQSQSSDSVKKLHDFIEYHCSKSIENTAEINQKTQELIQSHSMFSLNKPNNMKSIISECLSQIDFFVGDNTLFDYKDFLKRTNESSLLQELEVVPNSMNADLPTKMNISKCEKTGQFLATFEGTDNNAQCFINSPLCKDDKYIIRIEMTQNQNESNASFAFFLVSDNQKQEKYQYGKFLTYHEGYGGSVTKIVKGDQFHWGMSKKIRRKRIEFRIHLADKLFRVASYPTYKQVSDLKDPSLIKDDETYFFGICIGYPSDQVRFLEIAKVKNFDDNTYQK